MLAWPLGRIWLSIAHSNKDFFTQKCQIEEKSLATSLRGWDNTINPFHPRAILFFLLCAYLPKKDVQEKMRVKKFFFLFLFFRLHPSSRCCLHVERILDQKLVSYDEGLAVNFLFLLMTAAGFSSRCYMFHGNMSLRRLFFGFIGRSSANFS